MNIPNFLLRFFHPADKRQREKIRELLSLNGPMTGLDLVAQSGGVLKRGTVYVHLAQMIDDGEILSLPNRTYRLEAEK